MSYIKEPAGIDFVVDPTPLSPEERKKITEIIAYYQRTGRKLKADKTPPRERSSRTKKKVNA